MPIRSSTRGYFKVGNGKKDLLDISNSTVKFKGSRYKNRVEADIKQTIHDNDQSSRSA